MSPAFLRTAGALAPIEPALDVYELDDREPCVRIGHDGTPFLLRLHGASWRNPAMLGGGYCGPQILFADVPVMIHTSFGFSLAPLSDASDQTGPEGAVVAARESKALARSIEP